MLTKTIGVMGSGTEPWTELAEPLGRWIAENGYNLLTGGGQGVMLSVARGFCSISSRTGLSIAIVPTRADPVAGFVPLDGYPNRFVDLPIITPLPRHDAEAPPNRVSRNHINVLSSDVIVALPGGHGIASMTTSCAGCAVPLRNVRPTAR
ncbi:SLOG cluster 4 domain-containing protein [Mycetohabitans endofungorum]|uniref:SLOG cluster 4 domain-containing protein n=1 Tax=Mycetohabitans endofungorum TaxID=417203 RepID=UPI003969FC21